jgi:hypothetical protein
MLTENWCGSEMQRTCLSYYCWWIEYARPCGSSTRSMPIEYGTQRVTEVLRATRTLRTVNEIVMPMLSDTSMVIVR